MSIGFRYLCVFISIQLCIRCLSIGARYRTADVLLRCFSDVFADIDRSNTQRLEIFLPKVSRGDVLCIDVCCVPSDMRTFDLMDVCEGMH